MNKYADQSKASGYMERMHFNGCLRKKCIPTRERAEESAARASRDTGIPMKFYKRPTCPGYHIAKDKRAN